MEEVCFFLSLQLYALVIQGVWSPGSWEVENTAEACFPHSLKCHSALSTLPSPTTDNSLTH